MAVMSPEEARRRRRELRMARARAHRAVTKRQEQQGNELQWHNDPLYKAIKGPAGTRARQRSTLLEGIRVRKPRAEDGSGSDFWGAVITIGVPAALTAAAVFALYSIGK